MSLLPKGGARSESSLAVQGCAIVHVMQEGAVAAAFHVRLPGGAGGARLLVMLQQLVASPKFQSDVFAKTRMTVDDASTGVEISVHCMVSAGGLVLLACTQQDYPSRIVFPSSSGGDLLARVSDVADEMLGVDAFVAGGRGAPGSVRRVQLGDRVTAALERICADFEDKGAHDSVARVQGEVEEAKGLMQGTLESMLHNQDQLTSLHSKTDAIAGQSRGFFREARTTRRQMQCEEFRNKLIIASVAVLLFFWIFGGWIFGGDEQPMKLHIPPSPPPPSPPYIVGYMYG